jgi:hypothetical protein
VKTSMCLVSVEESGRVQATVGAVTRVSTAMVQGGPARTAGHRPSPSPASGARSPVRPAEAQAPRGPCAAGRAGNAARAGTAPAQRGGRRWPRRRLGADGLGGNAGMELPQEPRRLSNVTENRSERVHSLFTSAALNKGPLASRDTMHTKVSHFSSVRYSQDQSKNLLTKDQGKDKDKESTGSRLLNVSGGGPASGQRGWGQWSAPPADHLESRARVRGRPPPSGGAGDAWKGLPVGP